MFVLSSLACAMVATAQTSQTTGAIRGSVKDHSGKVLSDAKVSIRSLEAGFNRSVVSDGKGSYILPLVPVGDYEITVVHPKMQTGKNAHLRVTLGETTVQNFTLDAKEASATVEVMATASAVDAQQVNSSSNVSAELVTAIPLRSRNFTDFVQLTPGAVSNSQGYRTSVDGARGVQNNFMIDGASYNSNFNGDTRGGTRIQFSFGLDSIRELQVVTNAFDAQYGNAAGGIINAVTKTGTNEVTGMLGTQLRPGMMANMKPVPYDPSNAVNTATALHTGSTQQEYAANVGGPIIKDVLHYFVNVDSIHSTTLSVPTVAQGATTNYYANTTPAQNLDAWNTFWGAGGMGGLVVNSKNGSTAAQELNQPWTDDQKHLTVLARLDWTVNMENHASLRYNSQTYTGLNDIYSGTRKNNIGLSNNSTMKFDSSSWVAELESTFGGNLLNDARFQYAKESRPTTPNSTYPSLGLPGITMGNYYIDPRDTEETTYQLMDTVTYIQGDLTLKAGIDWQWLHYLNKYYPDGNGEFSFSNWDSADWWWNTPGLAYPSVPGSFTPTITYYQDYSPYKGVADFGEKLFATFFQANYTGLMDKRLTLSAGLRYTREMWESNPGPNAKLQGLDQMPDNGNLDPRLGFALDVHGDNRTVLRGGLGFFSNPNAAQNTSSAYMNNGINLKAYKVTYAANADLINSTLSRDNMVQNGHLVPLSDAAVQGLPSSTLTLSVIDPRAKETQARRASLELEQDLGHGYVAKVKGTYQKTYNLQYWVNINMTQTNLPNSFYNDGYTPGQNLFTARTGGHSGHATVDGRNLDLSSYGDVYLSKYDGRADYKSLSFELNRMSGTGFTFTSSMTLSSSRDNNSNENSTAGSTFASPTDPTQPLAMSRSDNDVPFKFVFGGRMPPLMGFFLSGTFTYQNGLPYSPIYNGGGTGSDINGDNLYNDYALNGRNSMRQPYKKTFDLALTRSVKLYDRFNLDITAQLFNVFNWANQTVGGAPYNPTYYAGTNTPPVSVSPAFGKITGPDQNTRQAQFNLKLTF